MQGENNLLLVFIKFIYYINFYTHFKKLTLYRLLKKQLYVSNL